VIRTVKSLLLLCLTCVAWSQQYSFEHLGQENGLGSAMIRAVTQDRIGFLYVGTRVGLFRYDGVRFARFGVKDGLPDEHVRALHSTPKGDLWVATSAGLARLQGNHFRPIESFKANISSLTSLDSDPEGNLYVASEEGLIKITPDQKVVPISLPGLRGEKVWGVYTDNSDVWVGCGTRICLLGKSNVKVFNESRGVPSSKWSGFAVDADGTLWARGEGLLAVKIPGENAFRTEPNVPFKVSGQLISDRQGRLLLPSREGLWVREHTGTWANVGEQSGLPATAINYLYQDREGSMWIGTAEVGLFRWRGFKDWEGFTQAQGLNRNRISSIAIDSQGSLWAGSNLGLNRFHRAAKRWTSLLLPKSIPVRDLRSTPDGHLWVASGREGLFRLNPLSGQLLAIPASSGLDSLDPLSLFRDREGTLWVCTSAGLYRLVKSGPEPRFEKLYSDVLPARAAYAAAFDPQGRLWIAGRAGLWQLKDGAWKNLGKKDGLRDDSLISVAATTENTVWVGYASQLGISRIRWTENSLKIDHFDTSNVLRSNDISFIREDSRGWVWVGTDNGVDVFNGSSWRHLASHDGLIWHDTVLQAFLEDSDGSIWIGTNRGLAHYRPAQATFQMEPPSAVLTRLSFGNNTAASPSGHLTFPYTDRSLQIEFATLSFSRQHVAKFRYRLHGLDDRWVETDQRQAAFPNLDAGEYRFEVQAAAGGDWGPSGATMSFRILAPWWQQPWFRGGVAASFFCGIIFYIHARTAQARRQRQALELAVAERTRELELEKSHTEREKEVVERQKHEIEQLLRKAEDASRFKSQFLANVSHEIRTPMNAILGMTELALDTGLTQEQRECLETVKTSGESLLSLLNDILDLSKIEADRLELENVRFSLREAVEGSLRMFLNQAAGKGLVLESTVLPEVPDAVVGDRNRLRQVLLNLISNGIKFTNTGFVKILVSAEQPDNSHAVVRFTVTDSGIGIPEDRQSIIFDAFRQVDGSTTRRYGGTGLGLAICSRLVSMMGGSIQIKSAVGQGSEFSFTAKFGLADELPGVGGPQDASVEIRSLATTLGRSGRRQLRILVAEDNRVNQMLLVRMLEKLGHQVDVVSDGLEAVRTTSQKQFDLVLMDVQMPELDGLEATRRIRVSEEGNGYRLPILVLTANAMLGDKERCLEAGADGYLSKPVSLDQLSRAVEAIASQPRQSG
jgi:signal transduction histidine kinase/CheY-like chemotaxis protein/streptogramin lyase